MDIVVLAFLLATAVLEEEASFAAFPLTPLLAVALVSVFIGDLSLVLSLLLSVQAANAPMEITAITHIRVTIFIFRIKSALVKKYIDIQFKWDAIIYISLV